MKTDSVEKIKQKKQRELIRAFDQEMLSCRSYGLPASWRIGVHRFMAVFFLIFPLQAYYSNEDWTAIWFLMLSWSILAPTNYLSLFLYFKENSKSIPFYQKIKYLPVDPRQLRLVRIGYLLQFLAWTLPVSLILQCLATLIFYRTLSVFNILHVLCFGGILPFLITGASIWFQIDL